jgi:predicted ferric reductase
MHPNHKTGTSGQPGDPPDARAAVSGSPAWSRLRGVIWSITYLVLVAFPLVVLLLGHSPRGGGYGWDFAMGLGFGGLAMMGLQAVLTARFRRATAPFGMDIIYYFHRWAAVAAFALIVAHYAILRTTFSGAIGPLDPRAAPWQMTAGRAALVLFAVLIVTSLWRKALRIEYDAWRWTHAAIAGGAMILAMAHIWGVGHYTASAWKGGVWGLYTVLWVLVIGYIRIARPRTLQRTPYRVVDVRAERGRSWTVSVRPEGHPGFRFSPGQFAWLTLRASPYRAREHPFSISSSAAETGMLAFTIKELGDFTRTIGDVRAGEVAYVDGPHGVFTTDQHPDAARFTFIAGGIGIAPIMSMLRTLADRGDRRPVRLVYGNGRWEDVVFREEIQALASRLTLTVLHVLQEPPAGWGGLRGILDETVIRAAIPAGEAGATYFLCGPKPMSDSVQRTLRRMGVPLHRIHCELFDMA